MPELSHASAATVLVACMVAAAIAFVVGVAVTALIRRLAASPWCPAERRTIWRAPVTVLLVVLAVRGVLLAAGTQREWVQSRRVHPRPRGDRYRRMVAHGGLPSAWNGRCWPAIPDAELEDRRSRHVRTKIILVTRVIQALIAAITVAAILWTIPPLRDIGAGILASAGVIGVIVGIAAQTTLGNLFAGLQIAFTDAIRIDDIVVIGTAAGRIEEITLTYVAVRQSDNTTLILPCTYFTTTPFQNWTHKGAQISGIVEISVDSQRAARCPARCPARGTRPDTRALLALGQAAEVSSSSKTRPARR